MSNLVPVAIAGVEADCLMSKSESYSADIPSYAVEDGYEVSDSIILKPLELSLSLIISDTPVTWANREGHAPKKGRTKTMCKKLTDAYMKKKLVKVVTTDAIYTNMGITSLSINHSANSASVEIHLRKVYTTTKKVVTINSSSTMSGITQASNGTASTSSASSKTSGNSTGSTKSSNNSSNSSDSTKKACSALYGIASSFGLVS